MVVDDEDGFVDLGGGWCGSSLCHKGSDDGRATVGGSCDTGWMASTVVVRWMRVKISLEVTVQWEGLLAELEEEFGGDIERITISIISNNQNLHVRSSHSATLGTCLYHVMVITNVNTLVWLLFSSACTHTHTHTHT